jgi:hypothetical protein
MEAVKVVVRENESLLSTKMEDGLSHKEEWSLPNNPSVICVILRLAVS